MNYQLIHQHVVNPMPAPLSLAHLCQTLEVERVGY
jgi:hypothetical protein